VKEKKEREGKPIPMEVAGYLVSKGDQGSRWGRGVYRKRCSFQRGWVSSAMMESWEKGGGGRHMSAIPNEFNDAAMFKGHPAMFQRSAREDVLTIANLL